MNVSFDDGLYIENKQCMTSSGPSELGMTSINIVSVCPNHSVVINEKALLWFTSHLSD